MTAKNPFPPIRWLWQDYERAAAWYSGDPARLRKCSSDCDSFWKSRENIKVHAPMAADIAALSAGMIFATSPEIDCKDKPTLERIQEVFKYSGVYSVLLQAAELASVYGGVFLKWTWDVRDKYPRLYAVPANAGLPRFNGRLVEEITFWNTVREENGVVWRLQETYSPDGHIRSKLFRGDSSNLGEEHPLSSIEETKRILPDANSGTGRMLAFYVPNILPNHSRPYLPFGRSDFDSLYGLFDALDEAYSALQRELRNTKTTVIVPAEYLRKRDALFSGDKPAWEYANESGVFTALDIDSDRASSPITVVNPELRAQSRIAVCDDLIRRILSLAGYAPQSAGLDVNGSAESGTALSVRERKSIRTTEVKKTLWWQAINDIIRAMLILDKKVFKSQVNPDADFSVELPANNQPDIAQLAEIIEQLERASAVSVETKVDMLHPDWNEAQKAAEIAKIRMEKGYEGPDPLDPRLGDNEGGDNNSGAGDAD